MSKHYDVVVLGTSVGALAAAALLARRSWRVLVLGQRHRASRYAFEGMPLARRPFTFLAATSPAWGRVLVELAQSQSFKRRLAPLDPILQALGTNLRFSFAADPAELGREIDREFAEVRRVTTDLHAELARGNALIDAAFEQDLVWPPTSFWERRETMRVANTLPYVAAPIDLMAEFPRDHVFHDIVQTAARFASDRAGELPAIAIARLYGAWSRGPLKLEGGEDELSEFLLERVRAHGGEARLHDRATAITTRGGKVRGVLVDGDAEPIGVQFVVSDATHTSDLLALATDYAPSSRALATVPRVTSSEHRFVVSAIVRRAALPVPLGTESFLLPASADRPAVHLEVAAAHDDDHALLIAEAILESKGPRALARARESVLATLREFLPFIERHLVVVDSPHDGRPVWDCRSGQRVDADRTKLRASGGSLEAEPMTPRLDVENAPFFGLAGEPLRTPLAGAFLVGRGVLPALGQEGELLAAWSVARIITRTDRRKEKMRREMWSKVELG